MSWPWSRGSQGLRRSPRRSSSCKPADLLAFCLTVRVCVNVFVGPNVMNAPKSLKVSGVGLQRRSSASSKWRLSMESWRGWQGSCRPGLGEVRAELGEGGHVCLVQLKKGLASQSCDSNTVHQHPCAVPQTWKELKKRPLYSAASCRQLQFPPGKAGSPLPK